MQENSNNQMFIDDEQEIDIMELVSRLWKKRMMIVKWCVVGAVIGLVVGFSIPKTYKSGVTFAPETQQRIGSGVSSIASMMGVNLNNSVDAISVDMFPDVVHSTPFIFELFDLPVTFERKDSVITAPLIEYMKEYQRTAWWNHVISAPFKALGWVMSLGKEKEEEVVAVEEAPKTCSVCGYQGESKFCPQCGAPMEAPAASAAEEAPAEETPAAE